MAKEIKKERANRNALRSAAKVAALLLLSWLIYLTFVNRSDLTTFFANDQATDFIIADLFLKGDKVLLGPPSHTGGRHPGPFYYWLVTAAYWLSDRDTGTAIELLSLIKLLMLAPLFCCGLILCERNKRWFYLCGMLLAATNGYYIKLFRMHWQSHTLLLGSSLAFLAAFLTIRYGPRLFPVYIFCITVLFQSHLSSVPVVAGTTLVVLLSYFLRSNTRLRLCGNAEKTVTLVNILSLSGAIILWLPVLWHDLHYPSNLGRILSIHADHQQLLAGPIIAGSLIFEFLAQYMSAAIFSLNDIRFDNLLLFIIAVFWGLRLFKEGSEEQRWHFLAIMIPLFFSWILLWHFRFPLYIHYLNSSIAIPLLLSGMVFAQALGDLAEVYAGKRNLTTVSMAIISAVLLSYMISKNLVSSTEAYSKYTGAKPHKYFHTLKHAKEIAAYALAIGRAENSAVRIHPFMAAREAVNAYYFFMKGRERYGYMQYRQFFHELNAFKIKRRGLEKPLLSVAVMCPRPYSRERKRLLALIGKRWKIEKDLPPPKCSTCSDCYVAALSRKTR
ncbi:MAG: hypothetical protein D6719_02030 [Candidatus Dadabacteria bacterium]|nr:MAG: hypothetical protein D6719_02030 [Candidatus Dadabacteria bacterium]